jgi:ppGpp synthetase/RelA/SpoT-type nucleotidyltranferase
MNIEDYERTGQAIYAAFAETVAAILIAAIKAEGGYRLQQVAKRAKDPHSLRKKLQERRIEGTNTLELDIKDLAGCRVVFYTNNDVTKLINSGLIQQNFEVVEYKLHHPRREAQEAAELYISNHYLVALRSERVVLPEYAAFAGMRCEVQIQTILNHAWAEMAHDTVYKAPELGDFGCREFDGIKKRLRKVARKYLVPAGYEFQKIAYDFQRLLEGKALFDGDALEAIVNAPDNNVRTEALERFAEDVLPFYDDMAGVYLDVVKRLGKAAHAARSAHPIVVETPYGTLPAKTFADIVKGIAKILSRYRYVDIDVSFDALRTLYGLAYEEVERKPLLELGASLARHNLEVWRNHGPAAQAILVESIRKMDDDERRGLTKLITSMLAEVLSAEVTSATSRSSSVIFQRGAVLVSDQLRTIRTKAIDLLKRQFALCEDEGDHKDVLLALRAATRPALGAAYSNELARLVMDDTCTIISFEAEVAPTLSFGLLQATETRVNCSYRIYANLPDTMRDNESLVAGQAKVRAAALAFRDAVNTDPDFTAYKILVGFDCVYPPAWENDNFQYADAEAYRTEQMNELVASVNADNAEEWFRRLSRYARTDSTDLATFPIFGKFLEKLGEVQPRLVLAYINKLDVSLERFLPSMLIGLLVSAERDNALAKVDDWLLEGKYLQGITWFLRFAEPFHECLLHRALQSAIGCGNAPAVRNALLACVDQYDKHPSSLVENVFLSAVRQLSAMQDFSWIRMSWVSWMNRSIVEALDEQQAGVVLDALLPYPMLEYAPEYIVASIAKKWPKRVIDFLGGRQSLKRTGQLPSSYDAIPFSVHSLQVPLALAPDLMLAGARQWFDEDPLHFPFDGGRLLSSVFPELANGLSERLAHLVANCNEGDLAFVLAILSTFEGKPIVYGHVRCIVAVLDVDSPLIKQAEDVLQEAGVVRGEFGFVDLHERRKALLEPWLADENERVRAFAQSQIRKFEQSIAAETRSAEASIALRKLSYGEELDSKDGQSTD